MPNYSGSFAGKVGSQAVVALRDQADHQLSVAEISGRQNCTDEQWNDAQLTYWGLTDLTAGHGTQRGYWVNEHANGDRDWGTFEGRVTVTGGQVAIEGRFQNKGGTGRFTGISGGGTFKGSFSSPAEVSVRWEGTYKLAASSAAAR